MPKYMNIAESSVTVQLKTRKGEAPSFDALRAGETKTLSIDEDMPANRGLLHAQVLVRVDKDTPIPANITA
jgi:hypothetical protein